MVAKMRKHDDGKKINEYSVPKLQSGVLCSTQYLKAFFVGGENSLQNC